MLRIRGSVKTLKASALVFALSAFIRVHPRVSASHSGFFGFFDFNPKLDIQKNLAPRQQTV
jgi:hypothetical protein